MKKRIVISILVYGAMQMNAAGLYIQMGGVSLYTWDNGGADSFWGTADNWDPRGVPAGMHTIFLPAGTGEIQANDGDHTVAFMELAGRINGGMKSLFV